ncbi:MAG: tetratricopeptide repeat protein [Planctomycetes bacterium]|nr:tetratricopeptide repeat protein [Planctomycetota bacterium]
MILPARKKMHFPVLALLFLLSGIAGLIYEIAWTRMLVLVFGNTMWATATVLSSFMAGLALGAYMIGRYIDRESRNLIRLYAILECFVGGFALLFPLILKLAGPVFPAVYQVVDGNLIAVNIARFVSCFLIILVPTFFMGGTLPIIVKYVVGDTPSSVGKRTGLLYGLNTLGAVLGCLLSVFVFLKNLGLVGTVLIGVGLNLAVAAAAFVLHVRNRRNSPKESLSVSPNPELEKRTAPSRDAHYLKPTRTAVVIAIFISGYVALALEVLWTRMLALFTSNTVYSFAAILSVFLGGIAIGSLVYSRFLSKLKHQELLFVAIQAGIGLTAFATPYVVTILIGPHFGGNAQILAFVIAASIMLVPTILMGMTFPVAVHLYQDGRLDVGVGIGRIYAANTVGSILGAVVAGLILIPLLGVHRGIAVCAAGSAIAAGLVFIASQPPKLRLRSAFCTSASVLVILVVIAFIPDSFYSFYRQRQPDADILHYDEGQVANVVVYDFKKIGYKDLYLNSVEEASSRIWHVQLFKLLGILPPLMHKKPEDALMIAFGAGMSSGAAVSMVDKLDCVELNPDIDGVAKRFQKENLDVLNREKFNLIVNDGRNFLYLTDKTYDVIMSDATNPRAFDSWTLYTKEFYEMVKSKLRPEGIFSQWMPVPLPNDAVKIILNTFSTVFPHTSFWCIHGSSQCLMLATQDRLNINYKEFVLKTNEALKRVAFDDYGVSTAEKVLSFFFFGEDELKEYLTGFDKVSTDDLPIAQFYSILGGQGINTSIEMIPRQETAISYLTMPPKDKTELGQMLDEYLMMGRHLNLGFLSGDNRVEFEKARAVLETSELIDSDENVESAFHADVEKERYFHNRVQAHPDDAIAHQALGHFYLERNQPEKALTLLRRAVELEPEFAKAYMGMIRAFLQLLKEDEAVQTILEVRRLCPAGNMLLALKELLEIVYLQRKLAFQPNDKKLLLDLGMRHRNMGRYSAALEIYRKANRFAPNDPDVLKALAAVYKITGQRRRTIEVLNHLVQVSPLDVSASQQLSQLRWKSDEFQVEHALKDTHSSEVEAVDASVIISQASRQEAWKLWNTYDFTGAIKKETLLAAAKKFEESIETFPKFMLSYPDIATVYESLEDFKRAADFIERGLKQKPEFKLAKLHLTRLRLLEKRQATIKKGGSTGAFDVQIAELYWRIGDAEMAKKYLDYIIDAGKMTPFLWEKYGAILKYTGEYDAALASFKRAAAQDDRLTHSKSNANLLKAILDGNSSPPFQDPLSGS